MIDDAKRCDGANKMYLGDAIIVLSSRSDSSLRLAT